MLWEYLTPKAIIKKVYLYDEYEDTLEVTKIKTYNKMKRQLKYFL